LVDCLVILAKIYQDAWDFHFGLTDIGSLPKNSIKPPTALSLLSLAYGLAKRPIFKMSLAMNQPSSPGEVLNRMGVGQAARTKIAVKWRRKIDTEIADSRSN